MARPTQPRIQLFLSHRHDNARAKPSFFLGVAYAPDTPMAVSNKGANPTTATVWRGCVRTGQDWPQLKANSLSGLRCGGVFHPYRVWNHPHHLTPSCEPLQNHLEPPQCKPNTDMDLRPPRWLVSGSKVVSPVLFGWFCKWYLVRQFGNHLCA